MFTAATSLITLLATSSVLGAVSIDLNSASSIQNALRQTAQNMVKYYPPNPTGSIPQSSAKDATGIQWYESGIMWGAVAEYVKISKDQNLANLYSGALGNASFGNAASFLGGSAAAQLSTLSGKWNDDILWWSLATATGAETFGPDSRMPNGVKFLDVTINTQNEVWSQWDASTCNGGIFWSRDRNAGQENLRVYKSTITNAQFILNGARLAILTGNRTYAQQAEQVWAWLKSSGMVTSTGRVYDGGSAPTCNPINGNEFSYKSGALIGGLAYLAQATRNAQYLNEAKTILGTFTTTFSKGNIITDQCEPSCDLDKVQFKGSAIRGLMYLWNITNDAETKTNIQRLVDTSITAMAQTCDSNWNCNSVWTGNGQRQYTDVHTQMVAIELVNAAAVIHNASPSATLVAPGSASSPSASGKPSSNGGVAGHGGSGYLVGVGLTSVGLMVLLQYILV